MSGDDNVYVMETLTQLDPAVHSRLASVMQLIEKTSPRLDVNSAGLAIAMVELHKPIRFDQFFTDCPVMLDAKNSFYQEYSRQPPKTDRQLMMFLVGLNGEEGYHSMVAKYLIKILNGDVA